MGRWPDFLEARREEEELSFTVDTARAERGGARMSVMAERTSSQLEKTESSATSSSWVSSASAETTTGREVEILRAELNKPDIPESQRRILRNHFLWDIAKRDGLMLEGDKLAAVTSSRVAGFANDLKSALSREGRRKMQLQSRRGAAWPIGSLIYASRRTSEARFEEESEWCAMLERFGVPRARELDMMRPIPIDEGDEKTRLGEIFITRRSSSEVSTPEGEGATIRLPIVMPGDVGGRVVRPISLSEQDHKALFALSSGAAWRKHAAYENPSLAWGQRTPPPSPQYDAVVSAIGDPGQGGLVYAVLAPPPAGDDGVREGRVAGTISIYAVNGKDLTCSMGHWLFHPAERWGGEHMAGMMALLDHAFGTCRLLRVDFECPAPLELCGDLAMMLDLGLSFEGVLPAAKGGPGTARLRLVRAEWRRGRVRGRMMKAMGAERMGGSAGRWAKEWMMSQLAQQCRLFDEAGPAMSGGEERAWKAGLERMEEIIEGEDVRLRMVHPLVGRSPRVLSELAKGEVKGDKNQRGLTEDMRSWRYFQTGGLGGGIEHSDYLWRLQGEDAGWRAFHVLNTPHGRGVSGGHGWDDKYRGLQGEEGDGGAYRQPSAGLETIGDEDNVDLKHTADRAPNLFLRTEASFEPAQLGVIFFRPRAGGEVELGMRRFKCRREGVFEALSLLLSALQLAGTTLVSVLCASSDTEGILNLCRCGFTLDAVHFSFFVYDGFSHPCAHLSASLTGPLVLSHLSRLLAEARLAHQGVPLTEHSLQGVPLTEHSLHTREYTVHFGTGKLGLVLSDHAPVHLRAVVPDTQASRNAKLAVDANEDLGPVVVRVGEVSVCGMGRVEVTGVIREASRPVSITFRARSERAVEVERRGVDEWVKILSRVD